MGLVVHLAGALDFLVDRNPQRHIDGRRQRGDDLLLDRRPHFGGGHRVLVVQAPFGIDIDVLNARLDDAPQVVVALEPET